MSRSLIFVECLLKAQASIELINQHRDLLRRQQIKRYSAARDRLIDALWDGAWQLAKDAERCAEEAHERGQLLFCLAGTKAISTGSPS
jgi:hypothetical protein